ncbi:patatin-like phospholipase family protein [Nocardioides sp.]|uniref:patatin-like phospholipase family protein n=1 Tax=Nocardioides sp. TaxID=35761 RepID=UPI002724F7C4|nr:patatin-like phospholipase family protein [Nocardioides sp.]MDO9457791.1 patatin-like phospholipase family protein [Nocardioides sp.]
MSKRALVLGGGGITGIAWETGLLAGLAEAGVDLTTADRVIGTSAGSIVGAQITSDTGLDELYRRQLLSPAALGDTAPLAAIGPSVAVRLVTSLVRSRGDIERFGRILGRQAVAVAAKGRTPTVPERYQQVAQRIGGLEWNDRDLVVTAVDASTGELTVFGPQGDVAEVSLEDAVNASCSVPCVYPPIPIGGRTFIDGGVRSGANADLASGFDPVVVLSPLDRAIGPIRSAAQQLTELGVRHVVITPDAGSKRAIGGNVLDPAARPPSARAGRAQAAAHVDELRALWG